MNKDQLHEHPAYQALSAEEQAEIDRRLSRWELDVPAVAAATGGVEALEPGDLRFWLASTARRPWALVTLGARPADADALFEALLAAAPELEQREDRPALVVEARALSRALSAAEAARRDEGYVREDQLGALAEQIDALEAELPAWDDAAVVRCLRETGFAQLAEALGQYAAEHRGLRGLLDRVGDRLRTNVFDLVHGALFVVTGSPEHEGRYEDGKWTNWTANYEATPAHYRTPRSEAELCSRVAEATKLRVVGGGHSFNDGPLSNETMLTLDGYDQILDLDVPNKIARVQAGIRLRDLNRALWDAGLGIPVLGSTDAQSIGGLVATDLHGTGRDYGFLSSQIRSLRIVDAKGEAKTVIAGDPLFHAAIGAIGTCGVVAEVELQLVDAYKIEKRTTMVDRAEAEAGIDELLAANEHVSFYYIGGAEQAESVRMHAWNRTEAPLTPDWEQVERKVELSDFAISAYFPKLARRVGEMDEDTWFSDTFAPDRSLVMPGSRGFGRKLFYRHDEIEFGVPFEVYAECVSDVMDMLEAESFFSIVEVRFTPDRSRALLGPGVGRRTAYIELATPLSQDHERIFAKAEAIFRRHGGQPHLGKKTNVTAQDMLEIYGERFTQFQDIRAQQDPDGKFLNAFCRRVFGA